MLLFTRNCWNVTGNAGLTYSYWYLWGGVLDVAGYFFTQNCGERENEDQKNHKQ